MTHGFQSLQRNNSRFHNSDLMLFFFYAYKGKEATILQSVLPWCAGSCPSAADTPGSPSSAPGGACGVWCEWGIYCFPAHVLWLSEPLKHTGGRSFLRTRTNIWITGLLRGFYLLQPLLITLTSYLGTIPKNNCETVTDPR